MQERANIQLSRADRSKLEAVVANRNSPQKHVWRASSVLLTADGRGTAEIMQATGNRLGDCLGIAEVILLPLRVGANIPRRYQPGIVALRLR